MAAATLIISRTLKPYGCSCDTRNGACPNRAYTRHDISEGVTVRTCKRHEKMYQAEYERLAQVVVNEHNAGLHGTGEEREAFGHAHVRSDYWLVRCESCYNEVTAEEHGVNPNQVQEAREIQRQWDKAKARDLAAQERFTSDVKHYGTVRAVNMHASTFREIEIVNGLWDDVVGTMEGSSRFTDYTKVNLVDAWNAVAGRKKDELISNRIHDDVQRDVTSDWVRLAVY